MLVIKDPTEYSQTKQKPRKYSVDFYVVEKIPQCFLNLQLNLYKQMQV